MTEQITFRVPGVIQYSYMEFSGTAEELGRVNYDMAAALFASAIHSASAAERAALERLKEGQTAALPASQVQGGVQVQELPEGAVEELLKAELGAVEIDPTKKPWEQPAPEAGKKPWEKARPSAKVSISIDDF